MNPNEPRKRKLHPKERASILSKITFFYTTGIFLKTFKKKTVEEEDLYAVLRNCQSEKLGDELEKHIQKDIKRHGSLSLYRVLWSCYGCEYLFIGFVQLLIRTLVIVSIPMTISKLILYFQPGQKELAKKDALILAVLLILLNLASVTYLHNYLLYIAEMGIRIKTAFCSVMYRKCLKLSTASLSAITTGRIVTLTTKDATVLESAILYGNDAWIGFAQAGLVCWLIYCRMGSAAFVGIGFFFFVVPVQIYIGKLTTRFRQKSCEKTDERLQTTKETLSAIEIVKMYVWERYFERKISDERKAEMNMILKIYLTKIVLIIIGTLTSKIAFYLLFMAYLWFGGNSTAELMYYMSTLFLRIRHALNVAIPVGVTTLGELHAAVNRIDDFMNIKDLPEEENQELHQIKPGVIMDNVTLSNTILKNISMTINTGLTFISGPLACGKTSLLKTILGEYDIETGSKDVKGSMSYASQEPWIFPSSVKQNIIFGQGFNRQRYDEVLRVCDLNLDISNFEQGDNMLIGDKGMNLSKGQKARVNLARAVYRRADIYLLDDCLSSVDNHVRKNIFQKCIRDFLKDKIVIFVTQNLEYSLLGDNLILMKNGTIRLHKTIHGTSSNESVNKRDEVEINTEVDNVIGGIGRKDDTETTALLDRSRKIPDKDVYREIKQSGKVPWNVYEKYISYGGGYFILFLILIFFVGTQFSKSYTEKILSNWIDKVHEKGISNTTASADEMLLSSISVIYSSLTFATIVLSLLTSFVFFNFTRQSSVGLHNSMVGGMMNAVMQFYDDNHIGNILNRFSTDLRIIDEMFPFIVFDFFEIFFGLCGMIILIASVNLIFLIPAVIISIVLMILRRLYMPTGRNLQRLDATTRSPVVGYLNATLEGLATIRVCRAEHILMEEFDNHQNLCTSANLTSKCCQRAFGFALDLCCTIFIGFIIGICLVLDEGTSVGDVGLAITQAFTLTGVVQYGIRQWAEIESKITSVERVLEYREIPQENKRGHFSTSWPQITTIVYDNVSLRYGSKEEYDLKNLSFTINKGERIGIVGRTGAGKSSIISTLFRLYDFEGRITIGAVDIKDLPLDVLRSHIAIIPQDPVLFSGTIRNNIDPLEKYEDTVIWKAIEKVKLKYVISSLSSLVRESGSNFSAGQRQLICLARALVSRNEILVLDEATADMDPETDSLIHEVMMANFSGCTSIIVAHRLRSVMSCDKVMVIQMGKIAEYDDPKVLSSNDGGFFHSMLKEAGILEAVS